MVNLKSNDPSSATAAEEPEAMSMEPTEQVTQTQAAVGCSAWLGGIGGESCDDSFRSTLRDVNNSEDYLRKVYDYPGHVAVIADAAKKKGMRFDVASFPNGEITYTKNNIMVLRGSACEFINRLLECNPSGVSRKKTPLLFLRRGATILTSAYNHVLDLFRGKCPHAHKLCEMPPNDPSSATRRTEPGDNQKLP